MTFACALPMDDLAQECLEFLAEEVVQLQRAATRLADVHKALRFGQWAVLAEDGESHTDSSDPFSDRRIQRDRLRQRIIDALGLSETRGTIQSLANSVDDPLRSDLLGVRRQVSELAHDVQRRTRQNEILVVHSMRLLEDAIAAATGATTRPASYSQDGHTAVCRGRRTFITEI